MNDHFFPDYACVSTRLLLVIIDWYLAHKGSNSTEKTAVHSNIGLNAEGCLATVTTTWEVTYQGA